MHVLADTEARAAMQARSRRACHAATTWQRVKRRIDTPTVAFSPEHWSLDKAGLGRFDEDGGGSYNGGFTGDWDGPADFGDSSTVEAVPDRMLSVIRGRTFANIMEVCTRAARKYAPNMSSPSSCCRCSYERPLCKPP